MTIQQIWIMAFVTGCAVLVWFGFARLMKQRERGWVFTIKQDNNKALASVRLSAYERLVIMLERITPQSLILRHHIQASNAGMLQRDLIRAIREEFEHNISLQVYVSMGCWDKVTRARDETIELIKIAATKVDTSSDPLFLSQEVIALESIVQNSAIREAILAIRQEMDAHYG